MLHAQKNRTPLTRLGWCAAALVALGVSLPLAAAGTESPAPMVTSAPLADVEVTTPQQAPAKAAPPLTVELKPTAVPPTRPVAAPVQAGSVTGRVTDPSGGVMPGVTLTITDQQTKSQQTTMTAATGRFTFADLPPGQYELMAKLSGFRSVVVWVTVSSSVAGDHSITLPIGSLSETITVRCTSTQSSILGAIFPVLHAQERPTPIRVGGQIREPKKTTHVAPACPSDLASGDTTVMVTGTIGVDGLVTDIEPGAMQTGVQPTPAMFDAVTAAVREWIFTPTRLNGQPIAVTINVTVNFTK